MPPTTPDHEPAHARHAGDARALRLFIPDMDCPVEEAQIRAVLEEMPGIRRLRFELDKRILSMEAPEAIWPDILDALHALGFATQNTAGIPADDDTRQGKARKIFIRLIAALVIAALAELIGFFAPETWTWKILGMAAALIAIALSGAGVFRKGFTALGQKNLNINALMTVAVCGAFLIGEWPEAAMVMALYSLAEILEARSVERARNAIAGLLALSPSQISVRQESGAWGNVPVESVKPGAMARAMPGERFALDGRVCKGAGSVDQSPITGESLPVYKTPGDEVFAGAINQDAMLEFEVLKPANDTVLARIIHAVEEAQGKRAPTARFIDRFAAIYTPAVFFLALCAAFGMPLLLHREWLAAFYEALVLLVIACPCALVISTPVTIASGLAAAARRGILIKGGVYLEDASKLEIVALDKTGTLTQGKPVLVERRVLSSTLPANTTLQAARALAAASSHPVSKAIAAALDDNTPTAEVGQFNAEPGRGVSGVIDAQDCLLGNHRWIEERGLCSPELESLMRAHETQGRTVTLLANTREVLALFAVADTPRAESKAAIAELEAMGVRAVMLTGDNPATAQNIAAQVGILEVRANLLPEDKLEIIRGFEREGKIAAMVGDGINDGPALGAARIGFGMGAGTDTATEAADVLVMNNDLRRVPETLRLSRKTRVILWQNIALALSIKLAFLVLTLLGHASMWMAVFADVGASLLVILNGLRLLNGVKPKPAGDASDNTVIRPSLPG
jgi:Cd2+/Zn2+-exporting ATPase